MNMISKIKESKQRGEQYQRFKQLSQLSNDMKEFKSQLDAAEKAYNNARKIQAALAARGKVVLYDSTNGTDAIADIQAKLSKTEFAVSRAKSLAKDAKNAEAKMIEFWEAYYNERTEAPHMIIQTVRALVSEEPEYKALSDADSHFHRNPAGSEMALKAIDRYVESYNRLMNKLNLSSETLSLLKQLSDNGFIPLDRITEESLVTLKKLNFASKLKIVTNIPENR